LGKENQVKKRDCDRLVAVKQNEREPGFCFENEGRRS
jgi:hypothetical protein